jgi:hypothetical protein
MFVNTMVYLNIFASAFRYCVFVYIIYFFVFHCSPSSLSSRTLPFSIFLPLCQHLPPSPSLLSSFLTSSLSLSIQITHTQKKAAEAEAGGISGGEEKDKAESEVGTKSKERA